MKLSDLGNRAEILLVVGEWTACRKNFRRKDPDRSAFGQVGFPLKRRKTYEQILNPNSSVQVMNLGF
jgi:hypothetical protein